MAIDFYLTADQLEIAETEARRRQSSNESRNHKGRNNAPGKGEAALEMHRLGCVGEVVAAYYLGFEDYLFIDKVPIKDSRDLPKNIEVKTRKKHGYDLLIQLNDDPSKLFLLVTYDKTVDPSLAKIVGWTHGKDVMRRELIKEFIKGRPCYAVPQRELKDLATLPAELSKPVIKKEVLSGKDAWVTHDNDEIILNFSEDLISRLGWNAGDVLQWDIDPHGTHCILRKANVSTAQVDRSDKGGNKRVD